MTNAPNSLRRWYPKSIIIPLALYACGIFLLLGLFLPIITLKELVFWKSTFSVITGIQSLFQEKHYALGLIILFFSIIFPVFKLIVLFRIWFTALTEKRRDFYLHWLGILGKWSMLDVFVVAVTIVVTKISKFAKAEAHIGIYFFALSILLAMILTEHFERLIKRQDQLAGKI